MRIRANVSFLSHAVLFILRQKNPLSKANYLGRKYIPQYTIITSNLVGF